MSQSTIIGIVSFALGAVLLFFAWRASNTPVEQISEALTGRYTENTMLYVLGGMAGIVIGLVLLFRGNKQG